MNWLDLSSVCWIIYSKDFHSYRCTGIWKRAMLIFVRTYLTQSLRKLEWMLQFSIYMPVKVIWTDIIEYFVIPLIVRFLFFVYAIKHRIVEGEDDKRPLFNRCKVILEQAEYWIWIFESIFMSTLDLGTFGRCSMGFLIYHTMKSNEGLFTNFLLRFVFLLS